MTWLTDYFYPVAGVSIWKAERAEDGLGVLGGNRTQDLIATPWTEFDATPPYLQRAIYKHELANQISAQTSLLVQTSLFNGLTANVMNWTPRLDWNSKGVYTFSSTDKHAVCLNANCSAASAQCTQ